MIPFPNTKKGVLQNLNVLGRAVWYGVNRRIYHPIWGTGLNLKQKTMEKSSALIEKTHDSRYINSDRRFYIDITGI